MSDMRESWDRVPLARDLLRRIYREAGGSEDVPVSYGSVAKSAAVDAVRARGALGVLVKERWVVREGRSHVRLTALGRRKAVESD